MSRSSIKTRPIQTGLEQGFTLLEILVAMLIVGIALGAVGIAIGAVADNKLLNNHANKLIDWLDHTRDLAIISHDTFRVITDQNGSIVVQNYIDSEWQGAKLDRERYRFPDSITTEWRFGEDEISELSIYPDFTYTPFDLLLLQSNGDSLIIIGDGVNLPVITNEADQT